MGRTASDIVKVVHARGVGISNHLHRMEKLFAENRLNRTDLESVHIGAYLTFFASFENSLEDLFLGLLTGRITHPNRNVRPLATIKSKEVAHRIVCGDRSYADWLPYEKTKKRAEGLFSSGRPFTTLSKPDIKILGNAHTLRNAIAHKSKHSMHQFQTALAGPASLAPSTKPAAFLRGLHAGTQTRIEYWMAEIVRIFAELAKK